MTKILAIDPQTNKLIGELNNRGSKLFSGGTHIHETEGEHSFKFSMSSHIKEARLFTNRSRFLIPSEEKGFHEFIIFQAKTLNDDKFIVGTAAYTEMDTAHVVEPGTYTGTLQELATQQLQFTKYSIGIFQDIRTRSITIEEHTGAYQFMVKLAQAFEMELQFRVETAGPRIAGRFVDFVQQVGMDVEKEVIYGEDLISTEMTEYSERITTRLIGIGPEREDGTHLTSVVEDPEAFQRWNDQGQHITRIYTPDTSEQNMTQARLDQLTAMELKKRVNSVVEYVIEAASIETAYPNKKIGLGYTLFIKNPKFEPPLYADARVIGVTRSIIDKKAKTYKIGEVVAYSEEDIFRTFRQLQRVYGVKLIEKDEPPPGKAKTIWINTSSTGPAATFNVPHTFNFETNTWEKFSPTNAEEIGGLLIGKQYNGVSITPEEGIVVDRTDTRVKTLVNATEGISIQTRDTTVGPYRKVFFADEFGNLTFAGIVRGSTIILGGENNEFGTFNVLDEHGEIASEITGGYGGFAQLNAGHLTAPNKVEYGDYRDDRLELFVANIEQTSGFIIGEPSDSNSGLSRSEPLRTIGEAVRRIPKSFDGLVDIIVASNNTHPGQVYNEEVHLSGFSGNGIFTLRSDSLVSEAVINGLIRSEGNTVKTNFDGIRLNSSRSYSGFIFQQSYGVIDNCYVNGASGGATTIGVAALNNANIEVYRTGFANVDACMRSSYGANINAIDCTGTGRLYAYQAWEGGFVSGGSDSPTGGTANSQEFRGGLVRGSWNFPAPPAAPTPTPVTKKTTWNAASDSGTWRADEGRWDIYGTSVNNVTQGSYGGYGPYTGSWFFGSGVASAVSGKTIKSIRVYLTRTSGGVSAGQTVRLRPHTSAARPGGNVSIQSPIQTTGFSVGQGKWVTLPSSFHAGFASGSYKGISIDGSQYMKFSKSAKIEITYED